LIKLIAIDLDGTLYNTQHQLTTRGREAIYKAKDAGIQPVIVTGRGRRGAENALNNLGLELPYICAAGALVRPGSTGDAWHVWPFQAHAEISHVIRFCRANPTHGLVAETLTGNPLWFGPDSMSEAMDPLTYREAFTSQRSFEPEKDLERPLLKLTIVAEPENLPQYETIVRENCPSIHQTYAGRQYIDLTAEGVNKGTALATLAERFSLQPAEIAAIGDQGIDLKMLEFAGLPVAMSNAVPQLKEVAHWIAPSNDEDGVAWTIDAIIQQNVA
jgi:Cof subfamily protein (haloacid dehalogenase superfamily)